MLLDLPRHYFSIPYSFGESMSWLFHNCFGPSRRFRALTDFLPRSCQLNRIAPRLTLAFLGDIMPLGSFGLGFGPRLRHFLSDAHYLVANFEGTISAAPPVFAALRHGDAILSSLVALFPPPRTILTCANNHAGDFGDIELSHSIARLKEAGFQTIGQRDEPSILLDNIVRITSASSWSNQPCPSIVQLADLNALQTQPALFSILTPHWGYEMQLFPHPRQIQQGQHLLTTWDMIVGHHSHCPQPITAYSRCRQAADETALPRQLVAYSLGDACTGLSLKKYRYGLVLKTTIGPTDDGSWRVGQLDWEFTFVGHPSPRACQVEVIPACRFFPGL